MLEFMILTFCYKTLTLKFDLFTGKRQIRNDSKTIILKKVTREKVIDFGLVPSESERKTVQILVYNSGSKAIIVQS